MTKAWSAHRWGDGSEDPAIVHVNVGSPVSFSATNERCCLPNDFLSELQSLL